MQVTSWAFWGDLEAGVPEAPATGVSVPEVSDSASDAGAGEGAAAPARVDPIKRLVEVLKKLPPPRRLTEIEKAQIPVGLPTPLVLRTLPPSSPAQRYHCTSNVPIRSQVLCGGEGKG